MKPTLASPRAEMSITESKKPAVCINLNDRATFKLSPEGRAVWRAHIEQKTAMMRNLYGEDWKPTESEMKPRSRCRYGRSYRFSERARIGTRAGHTSLPT